MRGIGALVLGGVALAAATPALAIDEAPLRLKFAKGDKLKLDLADRHTTTVEAEQAGTINATFELRLVADATVASVDGKGVATLKAKIARWRLRFDDGNQGGFTLDSAPERGAGDRRLAALNGKPFTVTVSERGVVSKVDGLTKLLRVLADAAPDSKTAGKLLEVESSDDAIRGKLQECWGDWPEAAVDAGASFPQKLAAKLAITGNAMSASATGTVGEVTDAKATVKLSGDITGTGGRATLWDDEDDQKGGGGGRGGAGGFDMGAMIRRALANTNVSFESGKLDGSRELDRTTGLCAKGAATWTSRVTLEVKIPAGFGGFGGGGDGTRSVPATVEQARTLLCTRPEKK